MKGIPYTRETRTYIESPYGEWIAQQWTLFDCSRINDLLRAYIHLSIYIYIHVVDIETKQVRDRR